MEVIDMLTKGAIGNLINRYRAVLKKCHLMNTFGSLAVASMLVMGAAGAAMGAVAQIGNNQYDSLAAAVDAAQSGYTIVLLQDFQGSGVKIDKNKKTDITIDLGGHEYTVVNPTVGSTGTETNGFQLLKGGELTIKNGTITAGTDSAKILIQKYCDLTLDNVTLNGREGTTDYTLSNNNGTTTVINGSGINASKNGFAFDAYDWPKNGYGNVSVVVDGSSINGRIEMETDGTAWSDGRTHEITLKNTAISNQSTTGNGGAIKINSSTASASIDNVAFNNNAAVSGGAIWNKGQVELSDASFTGNTASSQGGAIFNQGNMTVGATFTGNKANQGGAILNYGGTGTSLTVSDGSIFRSNEASSVGGAISHVDAGNMVIGNDVLFESNVSVAGQGGAIHNQRGTTEIGNNAKFINNIAKGYGGGAIYQDTDSTVSSVTIGTNAEFIGNETEASHGGAIMNFNGGNGAAMTIGDGATFDSNKAGKTGGAISNWGGKMALADATFTNNTAATNGGAIYNDTYYQDDSSFTISGATFTGNTASQGGAIYNAGNMTVDATFTGNKASQGGAILNYGGTGTSLTIGDGSVFRSNEASSVGGAISHVDAGNMVIGNDVLFESNVSVAGQGGAIHNQRGTTEIGNNAKFINNIAKGYGGGAIYQDTDSTVSSVTIGTNAEFIGNETEASHGGAIMNFNGGNGAAMTIGDGATFDSNKAGKTGGAISNWGGKMALADATFTNNTAATNGGAIYNDTYYQDDSSFTISGATFTGNSAEEEGGAIYNAGTMTLSGDNTFTDNTANGTPNDIHNAGALTVADGVTKLNSGYTQEGAASSLTVNTGATLAVAMPDMGGVTASSDEALLALGKQLNLGEGRLRMGSVSADNDASVAFGNNSLLVVDGKAANAGAMITGTGDISVDGGSRLYIANAQAGEAYTITSGLATAEGEYWKSANLLTGRLVEAAISTNGDKIVVETQGRDVAAVLPGIIPVAGINTMIADNLNDTDSASAGIRFLSRAVDNVRYMPSDSAATGMVNEVSRAAVTAGVQNTALRLADAATDQLAHHLSLSFFGKENNIHKDGVDIWATPMYGNTYTHGMAASGAAVRGNYGGVTLGADAKVGEILGGKVRVGAAVNGGGGKSETRGTVTSTDNEYNFGGVNLYAGWNLDNLNVMASVGYAMGNHDVKMNLPAAMNMGQAKADVDTNAFIADLRAEYQINTPVVDILPHAGVRYTALNTESHDLKVNGSTLNSVASDTQHIVQFPIGVTVSKDIDVAGWNVKPQADVSVIPAAGEKKNTTKVSYAGIGVLDSVNTRIMDSTSWAGMVGVQAEKGNFALGLNYGVQASSHETDQSVSVGISWKF